MKNEPIRANFEKAVVEPIENGYLATISTEDEDRVAFFRSFPRALQYLKTANSELEANRAEQ
jgi:hypothetical protein